MAHLLAENYNRFFGKKLLKEYLVREGDSITEVLGLNVFMDTEEGQKISEYEEDFKSNPQWMEAEDKYSKKAEILEDAILSNPDLKITDSDVKDIHNVWYDGSDAYESPEFALEELIPIWQQQIETVSEILVDKGITAADRPELFEVEQNLEETDIRDSDILRHEGNIRLLYDKLQGNYRVMDEQGNVSFWFDKDQCEELMDLPELEFVDRARELIDDSEIDENLEEITKKSNFEDSEIESLYHKITGDHGMGWPQMKEVIDETVGLYWAIEVRDAVKESNSVEEFVENFKQKVNTQSRTGGFNEQKLERVVEYIVKRKLKNK